MEKKERMALEMQLSVLKTSCENVPFKKKNNNGDANWKAR